MSQDPRTHEALEKAASSLTEALVKVPEDSPQYMLPGDPRGATWGYTFERWQGSFLVIDGDRVICGLLHASQEGKGYFRELMKGIEASGYRVSVPVPMLEMRKILEHYGFEPHDEDDEHGGTCDMWEKPRTHR